MNRLIKRADNALTKRFSNRTLTATLIFTATLACTLTALFTATTEAQPTFAQLLTEPVQGCFFKAAA